MFPGQFVSSPTSQANLQVLWSSPVQHVTDLALVHHWELQPSWGDSNIPHQACPQSRFLLMLVCASDCSSWHYIPTGLMNGCWSLAQLTSPYCLNQSAYMPTSVAALSNLACPQPWFSCTPAGAEAQLRSAHNFLLDPIRVPDPELSREDCDPV